MTALTRTKSSPRNSTAASTVSAWPSFAAKAPERGYTVVDPGRFPQGTTDYTAVINQIQSEDCDILVSSLITPELVTLWNQCQQLGYEPKIAVLSKGMHFSADVAALGRRAPITASRRSGRREFPFTSSLLGMTAKELSDDFRDTVTTGSDVTSAGTIRCLT